MPIEYAEILLAVVALFAGILYLRVRRTRSKGKKNKNAVRPASPSRTGMASQPAPEQPAVQTWAPPVTAPRPGSVASTVVQTPPQPAASPSWDQPAAAPAPGAQPTWGSAQPAPSWGATPAGSPGSTPTSTWGARRPTGAQSPAWGGAGGPQAPAPPVSAPPPAGAPPPPPPAGAPPPPPPSAAPPPPPPAAAPPPPAPAWEAAPAAPAAPAAAPPPSWGAPAGAPPAWGPPAAAPAPPPAAPAASWDVPAAPPIPVAERTIIAPPPQHESTTVIPAWQPPPAPAASTGGETQPILRAQTGAGPQAQLNIESGPDAGNNHRAGDAALRVGRSPDNDLILRDPATSGHHARIERRGQQFWIVDLGSTNGTLVNGEPIQEKELNHGDRITVGQNAVSFAIVEA